MHDAVLVQIADGLQHLLDHSAGILLRVNPPVQNTVKELTAWNTGEKNATLNPILMNGPAHLNQNTKTGNSQLHDKVVMGPTFIEILHPDDIFMLDSVE